MPKISHIEHSYRCTLLYYFIIRKLKLYALPLRTTVMLKLDRILYTHRILTQIKTDNGPPFQRHSFAQFAQYMGFHHRKITPAWPKANSESERFALNKTLRTAHLENKNWQQGLFLFLRTTVPHPILPLESPLLSFSLDVNSV